jgi:alpha-N-arabinofuranosidase
LDRRGFLKAGGIAGAGLVLSNNTARGSNLIDSHLEILVDEPIGDISPNIYGHFIEHIGGVIYDGVWVGKNSKIPNVQGVRTALIEKLRQIKAPMIRWPGGCFADSYDWRDGIGADRPRRTNFWAEEFDRSKVKRNAIQMYEPNTFGTAEFLRLCKQTGAEPYLAANVRSLSALDFDHWVEYCNSPAGSTSLADVRAKDGSTEPYNVKLWGIGNESWGCGGNFTPQDYATEFRRFTSWVPKYGLPLEYIASGPSSNDLAWTKGFFEKLYSTGDHEVSGWSVHYYAWNMSRGKTDDWVKAKGDALQFDTVDWYESFRQGYAIEKIIGDQWAAIGEYDSDHDIKLVIDEYGPWYRAGTEISPESILSQQVTMRDALFTALTLDIFNRHAEKVSMAACAQLINCINALFLAHEEKFVVTPNFYIFEMYAAHQAGQAVRTEFSSPAAKYVRDGKAAEFWGLNGSASLKAKTLTLTVVNADASTPRETEVVLRGSLIRSATASVLSNSDMHAHNSFEQSQVSEPASTNVETAGSLLHFTFPPASVTGLTITLA